MAGKEQQECGSGKTALSLEAVIVALLATAAFPGLLQTNSQLAVLLARKNPFFGFLESLLPGRSYYAYDHYNGLLTCLGGLLILGYLLSDFLGRLSGSASPPSPAAPGPFFRGPVERIKTVLLVLILVLFIGMPTMYNTGLRYVGTLQGTHDGGVLQTEAALDHLLAGRNPYLADYRGTDVERNNRSTPYWQNYGDIPIVHHLPYLPFSFLSALPVRGLSRLLLGYYDQRFLYLLLAAGTALILRRFARRAGRGRLLVAAVLLNPYFTPFLIEGRNDILPFFLILSSLFLLRRGHRVGSLVLLGLACATKQFAWIFIPFHFLLLAGRDAPTLTFRELLARIGRSWREVLSFVLVFAIFVLPFLFWSPAAFIDDVLLFNAGSSALNYPLGGTPGFGAANLVLYLQLVEERNDFFPFVIPILLFGGAVMLIALSLQWRVNRMSVMLAGGGITLFVVLFFSRLFHDNHLGLVLMWLTVAALADEHSVDPPQQILRAAPADQN